jgi:hypothetical protein
MMTYAQNITIGSDSVREFILDPDDESKISLKILHFPLPVA